MRFLTLGLTLLLGGSAAYAGVTGTTVISYMIQNNSGVTANDLHVNCCFGAITTVDSSPTFSTAISTPNQVDFTGGSVAPGDSASFTLEETGDNFFKFPTVLSYDWTVDGIPQGDEQQPIYFVPGISSGGQQAFLAALLSTATTDHTYTSLYVTQNGNSMLLPGLPGTVTTTADLQLTPDFNTSDGVVKFGLVDNTAGYNVVINGTFTAATPEPATTSLCALALIGIGITARRRKIACR